MLKQIVLMIVGGAVVVVSAMIIYGNFHWKLTTRKLREQLEIARVPVEPKIFNSHELVGLPVPVQRYLRAVLTEGQPIVTAVSLEHQGTFNMSTKAEQWYSFNSTQRVITRRPGFDWSARIAMMAGVPVLVHDAYIAGQGTLHAAIFGLVSVAQLHGAGEMAQAELMRFLAETVWYPTALLPSQGVVWSAVDDHSARAMLKDRDIKLSLLFHFNDNNLIETVSAESRAQMSGGKVTRAPWQCRLWNYMQRDGMQVPLDGDASWVTSDGLKTYWRGHINTLRYEFA